MQQRIEYVDYMRGIAIILVVIGHLIQFNGFPTSNPVFEFIYSFHMPLFFAISGYITQKVTRVETLHQYFIYLKKKFITIALPLITWSLLVNPYLLKEEWKIMSWEEMLMTLQHPWLWFLKMLFVILVYYGIFNLLYHKLGRANFFNTGLALIPVILLTLISVYINIQEINLILFPYAFYLGCFIAKFPSIERFILKQSVYTLSFLSLFILATHWNFEGNRIDDIYKITISTFCFIFLLNFCRKFKFNEKVKSILQLFGTQSLAIYIIQFHLCKLGDGMINVYIQSINPFILFLISLIIAIPISYTCCIVAKAIYSNHLLSFLLFGKRIRDIQKTE